MRRLPFAVAGLATLTLLTACHSPMCTQATGIPGVWFDEIGNTFPGAGQVSAEPSENAPPTGDEPAYRVVGCVRGGCEEWQGRASDGPWLQVVLLDLTGPTSVTATLTVTDVATGEVVFDASTSVDLHAYYPNGPGCDPTVFVGRVRPTPDGDLVAVPMP